MYMTDVIWWGYTILVAAIAVFMLWFANAVRQKGG